MKENPSEKDVTKVNLKNQQNVICKIVMTFIVWQEII